VAAVSSGLCLTPLGIIIKIVPQNEDVLEQRSRSEIVKSDIYNSFGNLKNLRKLRDLVLIKGANS
jgi:hypothetical protein